jgi:hypothetical protein
MKLGILGLALIVAGCAADGLADYRTIGINESIVTEPTFSNNYTGVLIEMNSHSKELLINRAREICNNFGGLKFEPKFMFSTPISWRYYQYGCLGVRPIDMRQNINADDSSNVNQTRDLSIFKSKCEELGFKVGTESFGNCVLRLSK